MANYANGKIYKIVGEDGSMYFGSTTLPLKVRMSMHRGDKRTSAYKEIISRMDCEMILVENYPCESKKKLEFREGWYIRENPCVNRQVAGRTNKQYRKDNSEKVNEMERKWRESNPEKTKAYQKKYIESNPEKILVYQREYRENHREKQRRYNRWTRSFGDPQNTTCLQRCDPSLFQ